MPELPGAAHPGIGVFRRVDGPLAAVLPFENALGVAHDGILPRVAVMGRELSQSLGEHLRVLFRVGDRDPLDFAPHRLVVATMEGERRKSCTARFYANNPDPHARASFAQCLDDFGDAQLQDVGRGPHPPLVFVLDLHVEREMNGRRLVCQQFQFFLGAFFKNLAEAGDNLRLQAHQVSWRIARRGPRRSAWRAP